MLSRNVLSFPATISTAFTYKSLAKLYTNTREAIQIIFATCISHVFAKRNLDQEISRLYQNERLLFSSLGITSSVFGAIISIASIYLAMMYEWVDSRALLENNTRILSKAKQWIKVITLASVAFILAVPLTDTVLHALGIALLSILMAKFAQFTTFLSAIPLSYVGEWLKLSYNNKMLESLQSPAFSEWANKKEYAENIIKNINGYIIATPVLVAAPWYFLAYCVHTSLLAMTSITAFVFACNYLWLTKAPDTWKRMSVEYLLPSFFTKPWNDKLGLFSNTVKERDKNEAWQIKFIQFPIQLSAVCVVGYNVLKQSVSIPVEQFLSISAYIWMGSITMLSAALVAYYCLDNMYKVIDKYLRKLLKKPQSRAIRVVTSVSAFCITPGWLLYEYFLTNNTFLLCGLNATILGTSSSLVGLAIHSLTTTVFRHIYNNSAKRVSDKHIDAIASYLYVVAMFSVRAPILKCAQLVTNKVIYLATKILWIERSSMSVISRANFSLISESVLNSIKKQNNQIIEHVPQDKSSLRFIFNQ